MRTRLVVAVVMAVALAATGVLWRLGTAACPVVSPAPAVSGVPFGPLVVVAYGTPIGTGDRASHVIDLATGAYRPIGGNLHAVSPDVRWAVVSVGRVGELPQAFDFWLYDLAAGRRAEQLGT